jgi:hypothetical protein
VWLSEDYWPDIKLSADKMLKTFVAIWPPYKKWFVVGEWISSRAENAS